MPRSGDEPALSDVKDSKLPSKLAGSGGTTPLVPQQQSVSGTSATSTPPAERFVDNLLNLIPRYSRDGLSEATNRSQPAVGQAPQQHATFGDGEHLASHFEGAQRQRMPTFDAVTMSFVSQMARQYPPEKFLEKCTAILLTERDWRIFVQTLRELPNQLINKPRFINAATQINNLRGVLCDTLSKDKFGEHVIDSMPHQIKKPDLVSEAYKVLTMLIAYSDCFGKSQQDELVLCFQSGLQKWAQTAKPCIHALTLACHDLPGPIARLLPGILVRLVQVMSTPSMSVHILMFLDGLVHMPHLFSNFVEADYRRVLGIALQYLQRQQQSIVLQLSGASAPSPGTAAPGQGNTAPGLAAQFTSISLNEKSAGGIATQNAQTPATDSAMQILGGGVERVRADDCLPCHLCVVSRHSTG